MKHKEKLENKIKKRGKLERKVLVTMLIIFVIAITSTMTAIFMGFYDEKVEEIREDMTFNASLIQAALTKPLEDKDYSDMSIDEMNKALDQMTSYGEFVDDWLENGKNDHYDYVKDRLTESIKVNEYDDIFIYKPKLDENGEIKNDMVIVMDVTKNGDSEYDLGDDFGESRAFETVKKVYETNEAVALERTAINKSGFMLVAYAPVRYSDGTVCAVAGIEYSAFRIVLAVFKDYSVILFNTLINYILFWAIAYIFIKVRVVKPVNTISAHMNKFVSNKETLEFEPITDIHTNDEVEQIADDFNSLAQSVIDYTKNLELKTSEEQRLKLDLDVANQMRRVVSSEITYPAFPERSDFDMFASLGHTMYNKCSFFNYFFTKTDHLFIVLGESLGSSLASMVFSILSVSYIKSFAKTGAAPCKIAFDTNNQLCSNEKKDSEMTVGAVIVDIDLSTGLMRYVNAGMPPILIKKPGEDYAPDKASQPFCLGQMRGIAFEQQTIQLSQGSTVLFTSYGVTEMSNDNGKKYGLERLVGRMNSISGSVYALNDTLKALEDDLEKYRGSAEVSMDTAVVAFRYFG